MADNLFDFFVNREAERKRRMAPPEIHPRRVLSLPTQPATPNIPAAENDVNRFMREEAVQPQQTAEARLMPPVVTPTTTPTATPTLTDPRQAQRDRIKQLETDPVINKDHGFLGRLGDVLRQALVSAGQSYDNARGTGWERLGAAAGGGIAGGVYGGIHPQVDEERQRLYDIAKAKYDLNTMDQEANQKLSEDYAKARTANIYADNDFNRLRLETTAEQKAATEQNRALSNIYKNGYFDPKNPIHAQLAKSAGIDPSAMQGFDDRNPITKQVAGVTYKLNRQTGSFERTDLPTDETKTLTDYTVTMPNGEKRTYKVAQKDAANFSTQMSALGARLNESARQFNQRMALSREQFDQAKLQFAQTMELRRQAQEALNNARNAGDRRAYESAQMRLMQVNNQIQSMRQHLETSFSKGDLTQEQYDALLQFYP